MYILPSVDFLWSKPDISGLSGVNTTFHRETRCNTVRPTGLYTECGDRWSTCSAVLWILSVSHSDLEMYVGVVKQNTVCMYWNHYYIREGSLSFSDSIILSFHSYHYHFNLQSSTLHSQQCLRTKLPGSPHLVLIPL
jgi:hypothetical protein